MQDRTDKLEFERLSKSCTMSGTGEMALSVQALRDDALSVCSTETVRSMPLVVQRSLFFTLEELRYNEPATEAGRALAWLFFLV